MERSVVVFLVVLLVATSSAKKSRRSYENQHGGKLTFFAIGDAGGNAYYPYFTKTLQNVATQMAKTARDKNAQFVIGLGDNFYWNGVKNVFDPRFNETFEDVFTDSVLRRAKWYMLAGNHDYLGNISAQIAYTKYSKRWQFPDFYYTTVHQIPGTCQSVEVVTIDTTLLCYKGGGKYPSKEQQHHWLEETLKKSMADYLLVAGHHPVYSIGMHGSNHCLLQKLKPLLDKYKVTAYLSGHDHNMQHIKPQDSQSHYIVSGSASNHNTRTNNRWSIPPRSLKFFDGNHGGFALFEADPKQLQVSFLNTRGQLLHYVTIKPRFYRQCYKKKSHIPKKDNVYDDDLDEQFDSVLDTFFGLQEEEERKKRAESQRRRTVPSPASLSVVRQLL